ncbi:MAG: DUF2971 domain-containing protein, partial [Candidatus Kapaibacterium sp.]
MLEKQQIRFTQAKYLNDPFEWLPFVDKFMSELAASNFYKQQMDPIVSEVSNRNLSLTDIPEEFRDKIPQTYIEQFTKLKIEEAFNLLPQFHPANITQMILAGSGEQFNINISELLRKSWNKYFGVLSLTQSNGNIPMWSHYARNHEGFVIEFVPENNFFRTQENAGLITRQAKPVNYTAERKKINLIEELASETKLLNRIANEVFFTKSSHWREEEEVRVLDRLDNHSRKLKIEDQEIYLFDFEPATIKAVYLGVNITDKTKSDLTNILDSDLYSHVQLFKGEL